MSSTGGGQPHPAVPHLPANQQTWFGRAIAWLKGEVSGGLAALTDWLSHDAFPFIENFLKQTALDELKALEPLATAAAAEVVADIPTMLSNPGGFLGALTGIIDTTFQKAQAAGLNVAQSSITTAAQAALHNLIAAQAP